jgi:amino-acid N-acetyltransferase
VGNAVLAQLLSVADELGVARVFCLTCEVDAFAGNGFQVLEGTPVEPEVHA